MNALGRFFKKVNKTDTCWLWTGSKNKNGYGAFFDGRFFPAHKWSYLQFKGAIDEGYYVCHTCDVPACVNPDHLWLGTPHDNYQDARKKGRVTYKLTPDQVAEIKFLINLEVPRRRIAEMFGVGHCTIVDIATGETWAWVKTG